MTTTTPWLIDSGSFMTITPFREDFETYEAIAGLMEVKALGGQRLKVVGKGTVRLLSNIEGNREELVLVDTLHIPDSDGRLISVAMVMKSQLRILFSDDYCTIFNSKNKTIMNIPCNSATNQFQLSAKGLCNHVLSVIAPIKTKCSLQQLHHIMGHAHPYTLKRMLLKDQLPQFEVSNPNDHVDCSDCVKGKSTKQIHPNKASRPAQHVGHIVSGDLIDLREVPAIGQFKFVSVLVDQYSYYTSVRPIRTKTAEEVVNHIKDFNAKLRSITGKDINIFRSDAGTEYRNVILSTFAREHGIRLELGAPREPRDNGFVERRNRTLTDSARTVLNASKLNTNFWPFAYEYVCYTQNHTGRKAYGFISPSTRLHGSIQDKMTMHPFGSPCFVQNTLEIIPKLSNRSDEAIFLGYCDNTAAYRVYLNGSLAISQNIIFLNQNEGAKENTPPIQSSTDPVNIDIPFIPPNVSDTLPAVSMPPAVPNITPVTRHSSRSSYDNTLTRIQNASGRNRRAYTVKSDILGMHEIPASEFPLESISYGKTLKGPLSEHWQIARNKEIENWMAQEVAEVSDLPVGSKAIPGHWIHTAKRNAQGEVIKLKARCVADGNHQVYGRDFLETYAATPAPEIARLLLTVAAAKDWEVHQMDVDCAYLNAPLKDPVYMQIPKGVDLDHKPGQVLKLVKALYGLKQAGNEWAKFLKDILEKLGWEQSPRDQCLYSMGKSQYLLVYVDDILMVTPTLDSMKRRKADLSNVLKIKDLGEINEYIGIHVKRNRKDRSFCMKQTGLIQECIDLMLPEKSQNLPIHPLTDMYCTSELLNPTKHNLYRTVLGKLLYLARVTRPDISIAVNLLGRQVSAPNLGNLETMKKLTGYLMGTKDMALKISGKDGTNLSGMADADWAGDVKDRKSTSGYVCFMGKTPISWSSTKQKSVAGSTMYAEYMSLSDASKELVYLTNLASTITEICVPAQMFCDNTAAQTIAEGKSGPVTKGAKHIDIRYHLVRELVASGQIEIKRIASELNTADIFTKPLPVDSFGRHLDSLNLVRDYDN
ncbi:MAG: reverse transcriptase domain-containing protein [Flectobacillus sp.]|nr:reverse transcriptase domain-containing protein [Flectobacillus sp.]